MKFYKFFDFSEKWYIYHLILSIASIAASLAMYIIAEIELFWLINTAVVLSIIGVVWGVALIACVIIQKVVEWREERQYWKEFSDEETLD